MGKIDSLPLAAPRVCTQRESLYVEERAKAGDQDGEGRKKEICTSKKYLNEQKETSALEAGSVLLAVPFQTEVV